MLASSLVDCGYEFVDGAEMRAALEQPGPLSDWSALPASWNDLAIDPSLAEHARYRTRRYAVYAATQHGTIDRAPHQPHFQHHDYNRLFGGIERWFEPITDAIGGGDT